MNKKLIAVLILSLLVVSGVFAAAIGVQGGWSSVTPTSGAVTFKLDELPFVFAGNFYSDYGVFTVGGTADLWFTNNNLASIVNYYIGAGAGVGITLADGYTGITAAARLPIGVNTFILEGILEPYFQVVPQLYIGLGNTITTNFGVGAELGIRLWF